LDQKGVKTVAMPLELDLYNRQPATSKKGKPYIGYTKIFSPGQSGRLTEADQKPPFYIRDYKKRIDHREWILLDGALTITEAKNVAQKVQGVLNAADAGIMLPENESKGTDKLETKIAEYLEEIEANKSYKTFLAYKNSLENFFLASCTKRYLKDVSRSDLLNFKTYLGKQNASSRSAFNNFANVMIFLKYSKHKIEIIKKDWPTKIERDADDYTPEEIKTLLANCDSDGQLLLQSLLCSGMRDGELAHLTYGDIDYNYSIWEVKAKAGWVPKTKESLREIPVPEWLTQRIKEREIKGKAMKADYIFAAKNSKPNNHLIRTVKRAAKSAKMVGRVDNHKFRATAITMWLRNGSTVPDVMKWVGHKSPSTILRYAAKVNLESKAVRKKATQPFKQFENV
jgi:integrase